MKKSFVAYFAPKNFIQIPYQALFMLITTILFFAFIIRPLYKFKPLEQLTPLLEVTPEKIKEWGKTPVEVKTGLTITDVLHFDIINNNVLVTAIAWFEFDPEQIKRKSIEEFSFIKIKTDHKYGDYYMLDDKKTMRAFYYLTLNVRDTFDFHRFPLDNHILAFRLVNEDKGPDEVEFVAEKDNFIFMDEILLPGWKITEHKVRTGYRNWPFSHTDKENYEEQATVYFELGLSKRDARQILLTVLPLLIIFYISLFSLSLSERREAIGLSLTSVSGLVAYMFVLQNYSPSVSYFMISDYLLLLLFVSSLFIFVFNFLFSEFSGISLKARETWKGILIVSTHIVILSVWLYLTNFYYF